MNILNILTSIEHNKHYVQRYLKFINYCIDGNSEIEYVESHHILPKSLFPEFKSLRKNPWNKANLSPRQHFIAHWILCKALPHIKMIRAFKMMCAFTENKNSKQYNTAKTIISESMKGNKNHNFDGQQAKRAWAEASDERRAKQAEIMREINKLKIKPKEIRTYFCSNCGAEILKEEHTHHPLKEKVYCNATCRNIYSAKNRVYKKKENRKPRTAWNKGLKGTGFGKNNPMQNPESIAKMIETRNKNRECCLGNKGQHSSPHLD